MGLFLPATMVVLLLAWVCASNHCGLALLQTLHKAQTPPHSCCHQTDAAPSSGNQNLACCHSLKVSLPTTASAPVGEWTILSSVWPVHLADPILSRQTPPVVSAKDPSPPPGVESFSERVLSRSLRAHAPPLS